MRTLAPPPLLCLVTDRRRMPGQDDASRLAALLDLVHAAARAGVDLVQVRELDLPSGRLLQLVEAAVSAVRGTAARVLVNDRLDVALAAGAGGVHLRGQSFDARRARSIAPPGFLVGRSVHDEAETARVAEEVDYLVAGTLLPTPSKPGRETLIGWTGLRTLVGAAKGRPVLAIGGVTSEHGAELARAGAGGLAAIGLFVEAFQTGPVGLRAAVGAVRRAFDSARSVP